MKGKKLFNSVSALLCVAALGTAVLTGCGGGPSCEHVYTWKVHEGDESTCSKAGKKTGVCGICGDIKEEAIPLDPTAHDYSGEWEITAPTEEKTGEAGKACVNDPENKEHALVVVLPTVTLSGEGYTSAEFVKVPTTIADGEIRLTYAHDSGNIVFTAPLAKRKLETVEDAVIISSSLGEKVRKSEGYYREGKEGLGVNNKFSVYYGNDYTSVKEEGNRTETWYSRDEDGNMFAMSKEDGKRPLVVADPDAGNLLGLHYQSGSDTSSFYGAEQGLRQIYDAAQSAREQNICVNYKEDLEKINEDFENCVKASFSFSLFENPFFCRYAVEFETYHDGTLKTLEVSTEIIRSYMIATDEDGNFLFYKEGDYYTDSKGIRHDQHAGDIIFAPIYPFDRESGNFLYEYDAEGNFVYDGYLTDAYGMQLVNAKGEKVRKRKAQGGQAVDTYYSDDHAEVSHRFVKFEQTCKEENEEVIENPYNSEVRYIKSFDLVSAEYGGKTVTLGDNITLPTNTVLNINIGNIVPAETAGLDYDPVESIFIVDKTGNLVPLKADFNNGSDYRIFAAYNTTEQKIMLNSLYSGKVELVFKTKAGKCEQHIPITFSPQAPSALSARASVYTAAGGVPEYTEQGVSNDSPVTVVTGQSLKFWAVALGEEAGYAGTDIQPFAVEGTDGVTFTQSEVGSNAIWNLVATKAGTYTIRMPYFDGNQASSSVYASFKLIVTEKPTAVELLSGKTFTGSVLMSAGENENPLSKTLTAAFSQATDGADGAKQGEVTITVGGNTSVYTYTIDKNGALTSQYKSGIEPTQKSYDFRFSINDAGDLLISHSTGMGKDTEDIVLKVKEN